MQDYAQKQLEEFRQAFENWQDEQEKDEGWERVEMGDEDLIGLACQIAAEYYGGTK